MHVGIVPVDAPTYRRIATQPVLAQRKRQAERIAATIDRLQVQVDELRTLLADDAWDYEPELIEKARQTVSVGYELSLLLDRPT
ncbi:hypothetical protein MHOL44478_00240 [Mycobacterium holsaticum DSM 44478]|nr:hypothetical protein [Mycolicibacterium holsaticum DSM 44478 = JCM 12374]